MIGKRLFQLVVHSLLCVISFAFVFSIFFDWRITNNDIAFAAFFFMCGLLLIASLRLNWLLLRSQSWKTRLPMTLPRHFVLIPVSVLLVYFSGQLRFNYDGHSSLHILTVNFPDFLVATDTDNHRAPITHTAEGIYLFLIYILTFSFLHMLHTLGFLSSHDTLKQPHTGRALRWAQLALGVVMVVCVAMTWYRLYNSLEWFIPNAVDGDLINSWNIGGYFARFVSECLLTAYAVWVMRDAMQLHRLRSKVGVM